MQIIIRKLTLIYFLLLSVVVVSCRKEKEDLPMSVKISSQKIELAYDETVTVNYTFTDADGELKVSVTGLPEGVLFEDIRVDKQSGKLKFTSSRDKQESVGVKVVFKDSKNTITKDLMIDLFPDRTSFSVSTESDKLSIIAGRKVDLKYSVSNADGTVKVSFKKEIQGLKLSNNFDKKNSKGVISFDTSIKEEKKIEGTLVFSDGRKECEVKITFEFGKSPVAPAVPVISVKSNIIYPKKCNRSNEMSFTIACDTDIDEVTVQTTPGIEAKLELGPGKKSGKIIVKAKENVGEFEELTLKAKNNAGESQKEVKLKLAYLNLKQENIKLDSKQFKGQVEVNTNLDFVVSTEGAVTITEKKKNLISFTVSENTLWENRTSKITVKDTEGLLEKSLVIVQDKNNGNNDTDRDALIAIAKSVNMNEWEENGVLEEGFYRNWGTDISKDKWYGSEWSEKGGMGRCIGLRFSSEQPKFSGIISEEIGKLTELKELIITPYFHFKKLPDSIRNLKKLEKISLAFDKIDIDLKDWKGLNDLMNNSENKMKDLNFEGTGLHGTIPEWLKKLPGKGINLFGCNFSGQIPDAVVKSEMWSCEVIGDPQYLEKSPVFDKSKFKIKDQGDGNYYYIVTAGEAIIYGQADNYALWVGKQPKNTKWVNDKLGGHWEWTK
jgi:hypothetical protein